VEAMKVGDFAAMTLAVLGDGLEHCLNVGREHSCVANYLNK
jgi:hypothetical protein